MYQELKSYYGQDELPPSVGTSFPEKSLTRQSELASTDINVIMRQYEKTGQVPVSVREGFFGDVSELGTYQNMLRLMDEAQAAFYALPVATRELFGNNVAAFLDDVATADEARLAELGLVEKAAEAAPVAPVEGASP